MAGIIAGQDYRSRGRIAIDQVDRLQSTATANVEAAMAVLDASLAAVPDALTSTGAPCGISHSRTMGGRSASADLALFGPTGQLLCHIGPAETPLPAGDFAEAPVFRDAVVIAAPALGIVHGHLVLAVARAAGVLAAILPEDWFAAINRPQDESVESALWLFDTHGDIAAANGAAGVALPPIATLRTLRQGKDEAILAESAAGVPYAYAATTLHNGWQLIGGYQSTREHNQATGVLYRRLSYLAVLLLLGLSITVLGADLAFGGPLRRLRGALADWQAGKPFDASGLSTAPTELVDLARSFTEATISLRTQREELDRAKSRQDLLMMEIHHRVKNNLQIVASLLNLQASRIRVPEARAEFQAARDRVRALATLHRHLYSEGEIHTINMPSFLTELCGQLFQAMAEEPGGRIKLHIVAEEIRMSTDQAVPLALIVTEAVTNAIKYGFPGSRDGTITIQLTQHESAIDLSIGDDGVGIPPGQAQTDMGTRDGLGLQLIRGFARQLGATLVITEEGGTHYSIHMPLRAREAEQDAPALEAAK